jgi:hypothetical protein
MPALPVIARAVGSVMTVKGTGAFPAHGEAEGTTGVGTTIRGLMPATPVCVAAEGIVASLYVDAVVVPRPGSGTATVVPNASMTALALAAGLQLPVVIDVPKE